MAEIKLADPPQARNHRFEDPLFSEDGPWQQEIPAGPAVVCEDNILRTHAVFETLRYGSYKVLAEAVYRSALANDGAQPAEIVRRLGEVVATGAEQYGRIERGGHLQTPSYSIDDYSYPIYDADPKKRRVVQLESYGNDTFVKFNPTLEGRTLTCAQSTEFPNQDGRLTGETGTESPSEGTCDSGAECAFNVPAPTAAQIRPSGPEGRDADGSVILIDAEDAANPVAFDFWQATTFNEKYKENEAVAGQVGGPIVKAGAMARFDLGPSARGTMFAQQSDQRQASCRASGLPYMGGLIIPEDIRRLLDAGGDLRGQTFGHALVFVLPQMRFHRGRFLPGDFQGEIDEERYPRDWFDPASGLETYDGTVNRWALAAGERIRLKEKLVNVQNKEIEACSLRPITHIFLNTLRCYGAYLADGGAGFGFSAEDYRTAPDLIKKHEMEELLGWQGPAYDAELTAWEHLSEAVNQDLYGYWDEEEDDKVFRGGIPFAVLHMPEDDAPSKGDPTSGTLEHAEPEEVITANFEIIKNPGS